MVISRKSRQYRVWKWWHVVIRHEPTPTRVSFCEYVGEMFLGMPICLVFLGIFFSVMFIIVPIVFGFIPNVFTILLGFGIAKPVQERNRICDFHSFPRVSSYQIPLWAILIPTWLTIISFSVVYRFPSYAMYGTIALGVTILLVTVAISLNWGMIREYIKAQKQKVCPIITFE